MNIDFVIYLPVPRAFFGRKQVPNKVKLLVILIDEQTKKKDRTVIVTTDFVMLNFPKTGSSYAREVLKNVYIERRSKIDRLLGRLHLCDKSFSELMLPKIDEELHYGIKDQHGTLRQIPDAYRNKPTVSITRNPFERHVSTYLYKWWVEHPPADKEIILEQYPHFPDLSFAEYYEMFHDHGRKNRLGKIIPKIDLGIHTIQFIQFYFNDPESVLHKIDDDYIEKEQYREDMAPVTFIHQENLNAELKDFLLQIGINENDLKFIETKKKVNVTVNKHEKPELDPETENLILKREKLLFKIFPEYLPM